MPYKNKSDYRKHQREYMKRWRSNPENLFKQKQSTKENREQNKEVVKAKERQYYRKNREHILQRCKEYQKENPQVKKRSQEKSKALGKGVIRGRKQRDSLSNGYVAAQIRKEKSNKSIEQKQSEILIYRLKIIIKKYE